MIGDEIRIYLTDRDLARRCLRIVSVVESTDGFAQHGFVVSELCKQPICPLVDTTSIGP